MRKVWHSVAALLLLALAACKPAPAPPPADLLGFDFTMPCEEFPAWLSSRDFSIKGDPKTGGNTLTVFLSHPIFWVVEVRCAPLPAPDGDRVMLPVELSFFSGGEDEGARITNGALTLQKLLTEALGKPWKNLQTGRWDSVAWTGSPDLIRHYDKSPADSKTLRVVFSRYPDNMPDTLNKRVAIFLKLLEKHSLAEKP